MNDLYKEILVKPEPNPADGVKKALLAALAAALIAAGILNPMFMLAGFVLLMLEIWLIFPRFKVEYEYLYVNGDIDIDAVYNKSSRKRKGSYDHSSLLIMAPTGSAHLDDVMKRQGMKVLDYTSRKQGEKSWTLVYRDCSAQTALLLELPDEVARDMRRHAPQKVFLQ